MHLVVPAGGTGGARFVRGLLSALEALPGPHRVTVVANTGDDVTMWGLRVCPDLDTLTYTLGGAVSEEQGWGRQGETYVVRDELAAYGVLPTWFALGDHDLGTHLTRTSMLAGGATLSEATALVAGRWGLPARGVELLPMTDEPVETHVRVRDADGERLVHFQEYWVGLRAAPEVVEVVAVGAEASRPAPGVLEAVASADAVLLPPSNPVVSIGTVLQVPGVRAALEATAAPVVGISPLVGGAVVRGMADKLLPSLGVAVDAGSVARHYGPALLDGWLVDTVDADLVPGVVEAGIPCRAVPLLMTDVPATAAIAREALELAGVL
ncbi:LPPG:FO 2-phospho-L-lactate transferase [Motilibacter rhizosphaerae]|uniref:LPPG:FO 2-phospho-L-lactate transferase n=1 Tax=Motilibacter rhizosphaerae TaxID=598652 RepID=A0A4Q7NST4_9ACTN|nr:2-phospho-L-lactate transferase [Motilibacter rhizosphaerae]RZS90167.1 LPPG:FO 2-phospho-L-lactate transferase [Motilibacter rhizosphaerae]